MGRGLVYINCFQYKEWPCWKNQCWYWWWKESFDFESHAAFYWPWIYSFCGAIWNWWSKGSQKKTIWGWFTAPIYGVLGNGLLLWCPHYKMCKKNMLHLISRVMRLAKGIRPSHRRQLDRRCGRALCCSPALDIGRRGSCSLVGPKIADELMPISLNCWHGYNCSCDMPKYGNMAIQNHGNSVGGPFEDDYVL